VADIAFVAALIVVAFDFQNLLSWWRGRTVTPAHDKLDDYTIIVPLFGHPRYFDRRDELLSYQSNVLVALEVSKPIMADFAERLEGEG
jgi:hypothetical protein